MWLIVEYSLFQGQGLTVNIIIFLLFGLGRIRPRRQILLRTVESLLVTDVELDGILRGCLASRRKIITMSVKHAAEAFAGKYVSVVCGHWDNAV